MNVKFNEYETPDLQQIQEEFEPFLEKYVRGRKCIIEIGTCRGGTLYHFMQVADPNAIIISIDLPDGHFGGEYGQPDIEEMQSWKQPGQTLHVIRADSHKDSTREQVFRILRGNGCDMLFIDGDHTLAGAKLDYIMYSYLMDIGGIIVFHDVTYHTPDTNCAVHELWQELTEARHEDTETFIKQPPTNTAGIGVIKL